MILRSLTLKIQKNKRRKKRNKGRKKRSNERKKKRKERKKKKKIKKNLFPNHLKMTKTLKRFLLKKMPVQT